MTWVAVRPFGTWMSQPEVWTDFCRCRVVIACSVTTVFGADVPDGSWLISWMGGLAMQLPRGQGH